MRPRGTRDCNEAEQYVSSNSFHTHKNRVADITKKGNDNCIESSVNLRWYSKTWTTTNTFFYLNKDPCLKSLANVKLILRFYDPKQAEKNIIQLF